MGIEQINALLVQLQNFALGAGVRFASAIAIFFIGRWIAKISKRFIRQAMLKANVDPTVVSFAGNIIHYGINVLLILIVLGQLGVETTSLIAVLGTAGLAVGLALQGSLANFAAGMLIILFRPFRVGDWVTTGDISGTVEEIHLFTTIVRTPDNRTVIVPNNQLTDSEIINHSTQGTIRIDLEVGIAYDADIDYARKVILEEMAADERVLQEPAPMVGVLALADSSVNLAVRPWTNIENYWDVYFATLENVKKRLDREGIQIPFPQRDLHLYTNGNPLNQLAANAVVAGNVHLSDRNAESS
ncbi:mechanosensitive ion channel [filamentous cyanobacterium LEGE 11480]|uniref:Mechanosensitive ion channel n=1 Tax=Romeriopsis navalis LEGE 11480 TaxID=2777977 RepID=A0A928VPU8_9CYAN|nr:mechanosensitive ion channel domain-containing protein [Romeriopsis navalis]MBE9032481.1 mechanosensitive ion channel [Romeriopsis navalis LEGE 11480]